MQFRGWMILRPQLNPTGTDTLRCSSNNPNEQNISRQEGFNLRQCFGPSPGREWWSFDAKNLELRIPAYECGEKELIDLFERADEPPYYGSEHLLNFSVVYDDLWYEALRDHGIEEAGPWIKDHSPWYRRCKAGDFAVGYGAFGETADRAFGRPGSRAKLMARFAKKESLNREQIAFAESHGYVETIPDEEVCPERGYPLLCSRSEWGRISPTIPLNYHVQGTAMWWMMRAMVKVDEYLRTLPGDPFITLQVHDELVLDFPVGKGKKPHLTNLPRVRKIASLMESCGQAIGVSTPVSIEYHSQGWDEGITL
jgi:DNA polymerase I-like protein with 3'-5' exonuclease and polymerase domains